MKTSFFCFVLLFVVLASNGFLRHTDASPNAKKNHALQKQSPLTDQSLGSVERREVHKADIQVVASESLNSKSGDPSEAEEHELGETQRESDSVANNQHHTAPDSQFPDYFFFYKASPTHYELIIGPEKPAIVINYETPEELCQYKFMFLNYFNTIFPYLAPSLYEAEALKKVYNSKKKNLKEEEEKFFNQRRPFFTDKQKAVFTLVHNRVESFNEEIYTALWNSYAKAVYKGFEKSIENCTDVMDTTSIDESGTLSLSISLTNLAMMLIFTAFSLFFI